MMVGEIGFWDDNGWHWRLKWRRERFEWESILEEELLTIFSRGVLYKDSNDYIAWRGDSKGFFFVRSTYALLANQGNISKNGVFSLLWKTKALPKVLITVWRILLDRIPTSHNILRRGVVVNFSLCALCNQSEESTQHLF